LTTATVRDVVDSAGELQNHVQYDAFGRITDGTASADFLFAFTGRPYDPETGLFDYRARWYDPDVGRFITEDAAGLDAGDVNLYRYCGNSPVINVDPSGLGYVGVGALMSSYSSPLASSPYGPFAGSPITALFSPEALAAMSSSAPSAGLSAASGWTSAGQPGRLLAVGGHPEGTTSGG